MDIGASPASVPTSPVSHSGRSLVPAPQPDRGIRVSHDESHHEPGKFKPRLWCHDSADNFEHLAVSDGAAAAPAAGPLRAGRSGSDLLVLWTLTCQ
jgi:hypothetical protein